MLILVILLSLIWIYFCTLMYRLFRTRPGILLFTTFVLVLFLFFPLGYRGLGFQSLPLRILTLGTLPLVMALMTLRTMPGVWLFFFMLMALTGIGLGVGNLFTQSHFDRIAALQAEFPLEKLSERLPAPTQFVLTSTPVRSVNLAPQLDMTIRQVGLKKLHETQLMHFINSPGFGSFRMSHWNVFQSSKQSPSERPAIPIKLDSGQYQVFDGIKDARLKDFHEQGVRDFVNPAGYGWVKEKQGAAGFEDHQFSQRPKIAGDGASKKHDRWNIVQLQLVSLLKHDPPMVYQSDNLPRMDELKNSAVRSLTPFESRALESLHSGESPVIDVLRNDKKVNMLGAIRARSDCRDCHHVPEGALLGAFSYELQRIDSADDVPQETIGNRIIETRCATVFGVFDKAVSSWFDNVSEEHGRCARSPDPRTRTRPKVSSSSSLASSFAFQPKSKHGKAHISNLFVV